MPLSTMLLDHLFSLHQASVLRDQTLFLTLSSALVVLVLAVTLPVIRYYLDPLGLRRFPAASALAATTRLWCAKNSYMGKRYTSIEEAHKRLGPVVRISSSHLSFNDPAAIKDIYGHINGGKILKDEFYDNLAGEFHNIANVRDREEHSRKRKYFSNAFALKNIADMEPLVQGFVEKLLNKLDSVASSHETININKWLNFFTFDVIGTVAVGKSFGFLENGTDAAWGQYKNAKRNHLVKSTIESLHSAFNFKVALGQMSRQWYLVLFKLLQPWTQGGKDLSMFTSVAINQVRRRLDEGCTHEHTDFFDRALLDKEGKSRGLPFMELVSEAIVLLNAGSDTTASSLTSLIYEVARNPDIQKKLHRELDEALGHNPGPANFHQVKSLPYLKATLDENLRLNPPIPYGPPRVVIAPQGIQVAGHHIKTGTTVSVPTHSIHRLESVFPDPLRFRPERWLEHSEEGDKDMMQKTFIPFSVGPRSCLGRNLAMMEQQVLLGSLFHQYEIRLADKEFVPLRFEAFNLDPGPLPVILKRRI